MLSSVGDILVGIDEQVLVVEGGIDSLISRIIGVEGSQVLFVGLNILDFFCFCFQPLTTTQITLHFVKPESGMKYSVTLTRSSLGFHLDNQPSPSSARDPQTAQSFSLHLPFQTIPQNVISSGETLLLPSSLPDDDIQGSSFEPKNIHDASVNFLLKTHSFERSTSTFARSRAQFEASIDFSSAFRLKDNAIGTAVQLEKTKFSFKDMIFPSRIQAKSEV